jgi:hypothetical protein
MAEFILQLWKRFWTMATFVRRRIRDDTGVRRLQVDELTRGLGIPSNLGDL